MTQVTSAAAFDPFEAGYAEWPYDQYGRLRAADPVHWSELLSGWIVTRYDDVTRVLRDRAMSSDLGNAKPSAVVDLLRARSQRHEGATTVVLLDGLEHARIRKLIQGPFTVRSTERLRASIEQRVDAAISAIEATGSMELIGDLAYPLPVSVFCDMLGIPDEAGPQFRVWTAAVAKSLDLVISEDEFDAYMDLIAEMSDYLGEQVDRKRDAPADDVLSALIAAEVDGVGLTQEELVAQLVTLYVAGHEPTTALVGNGMTHLLANSEQLAALQADPTLVPAAVQELLRLDGPNQFVRRIALETTSFDTPQGAVVVEPGDVDLCRHRGREPRSGPLRRRCRFVAHRSSGRGRPRAVRRGRAQLPGLAPRPAAGRARARRVAPPPARPRAPMAKPSGRAG